MVDQAEILSQFDVEGRLVTVRPLGNGNINDTYLGIYRNTFTETQVILQRVNKEVFPKPSLIMSNMHVITSHCHKRLTEDANLNRDDRIWQMPRIVQTKSGEDYVTDEEGSVWRVITKILSAHAYDTTKNEEHALECGATLGHFHYLVSDLPPTAIKDPLPGFHVTRNYLAQYDALLQDSNVQRLINSSMESKRLAKFIEARRDLSLTLEKAEASGELKRHMFHGDPKVNNIMIDDITALGTAMIDLDTVSPGLIHIDVGDAVRSICNPAGEEEVNLSKVLFNEGLFNAFMRGYLKEAGSFLTDADRDYLYIAIWLLPFELGIRFYSDYLAGNRYFKTKTPEQNLSRARVQFRLCESIEAREYSIRKILKKI